MICLSLNCGGLVSSFKNLALKRLVDAHKPDILMLLETMGGRDSLVSNWRKILVGWDFMFKDARG
jgi:hypothetical protein